MTGKVKALCFRKSCNNEFDPKGPNAQIDAVQPDGTLIVTYFCMSCADELGGDGLAERLRSTEPDPDHMGMYEERNTYYYNVFRFYY